MFCMTSHLVRIRVEDWTLISQLPERLVSEALQSGRTGSFAVLLIFTNGSGLYAPWHTTRYDKGCGDCALKSLWRTKEDGREGRGNPTGSRQTILVPWVSIHAVALPLVSRDGVDIQEDGHCGLENIRTHVCETPASTQGWQQKDPSTEHYRENVVDLELEDDLSGPLCRTQVLHPRCARRCDAT